MGARNRVGIGLYRTRPPGYIGLWNSFPWNLFLGSIKLYFVQLDEAEADQRPTVL
jgi:hypothetical protein